MDDAPGSSAWARYLAETAALLCLFLEEYLDRDGADDALLKSRTVPELLGALPAASLTNLAEGLAALARVATEAAD